MKIGLHDKIKTSSEKKLIVKKCHCCGKISDSPTELKRCPSCNKSFMPSNYFGKIHAKNSEEFDQLFSKVEDLDESDIIIGLNVLW